MNRFSSARHLASWAGVCPGNNESADYFETKQKEKLTRSFVKRLEKLGHKVTIEQAAAA